MTQKYRCPVQSCGGGARKAKAGLERDIKGNNKRFYKYVNSKRKTRENVGLLLNGEGK